MREELPVKTDNFLAEAENMDLSKLKDKQFMVAVSTGAPDSCKFLCSTVHGPYSFVEMVQEVEAMWSVHQHHARIILCDKDADRQVKMLDENTVDYLECHASDIITESMLEGCFDLEKDFTCQAGLIQEEESSDPRHKKTDVAE